jgi:hypothetical protein
VRSRTCEFASNRNSGIPAIHWNYNLIDLQERHDLTQYRVRVHNILKKLATGQLIQELKELVTATSEDTILSELLGKF